MKPLTIEVEKENVPETYPPVKIEFVPNVRLGTKQQVNTTILAVKKFREEARLPVYQTEGSSGFDFELLDNVAIPPFATARIFTGLGFQLFKNCELQIRSRSGKTLEYPSIVVDHSTIDSDYTGEVSIIVRNFSGQRIRLNKGDRIAQGVIIPIVRPDQILEALKLRETERGEKGFGSTDSLTTESA